MKKTLLLILALILVLPSCGKREDGPRLSQEEIDALNSAYLIAEENGDFVGMNKAKRSLGDKDYDYSYGKILTEYNYSYTDDEGIVQSGMVYVFNFYNAFPKEECEEIAEKQGIEENEFVVLEYTFFDNPSFQVRHSYKAENKEQRDKILDILIEYDKEHDTEWERTKDSMAVEWFLHNLSYEADFEAERAMHVDLDNNAEDVY